MIEKQLYSTMMMMMAIVIIMILILIIDARISVFFGRSQHLAWTESATEKDMTIGAISH